jgi:hydrogenase nickel insertion protein HypA
MHEYHLAQEIAERLKAEAEQAGARRIVAAEIEVGALSQVSAEHLAFWIGEALKDVAGNEPNVRVLTASVAFFCRDCRRRVPLQPPKDGESEAPPASCARCGSTRLRVKADTGCRVQRLELEQ